MKTKYMIRRTLCPWKIDEFLKETIDYCLKSKVDEIIWITESSGRYEELLTIDGIKELIPYLQLAKKKTEAAGMVYSLNPLTTIGHGDYGRDLTVVHPTMEFMVDYLGKKSKACACPLSPYWQELMNETFRLYAETRPARLWIEDDFRYNNHGPVKFGCYCDTHLKKFAKRTGKTFTREELVELLLRPGKPAPERKEWLEFLGDTLCESANLIADNVHAVSPDTILSFMSINPALMDICGLDTRKFMTACANGKRAGIRMTTTHFQEKTHRDMLYTDENLKKVIPHLPKETLKCIEVETHTHSLFSKSAAGIAAQIEWANILGVTNHTLNIFDYLGSPMNQNPKYGEMLRSRKDEFDSFAASFAETTSTPGVGVPSLPLMTANTQTSTGESMAELAVRENGFVHPLRAFGIPVVFANNEKITALTGQALRSLNKNEIESVFSRGVLLDGVALKVLLDMGFANLAGVEIKGKCPFRSRGIGPEELTDPDFGGGEPYAYTWTLGAWPEFILKLQPGAKMISRVVDTRGEYLFPGFVLYENALGGRVAVCPYNLGGSGLDPLTNREPASFYSEYRKRQVQSIVSWLGRDWFPLVVEADGWILPHRADAPGKIMLAAMNLNADTWSGLSMRLTVKNSVKEIQWADIDGKWNMLEKNLWSFQEDELKLCLNTDVPPLRMVAVDISTSS